MKKKECLTYILLLLIATISALYMTYIYGTIIDFDEGYSIAMSRYSIAEIWNITSKDVHPPLYYWGLSIYSSILKISTSDIFPYRLFSVIAYIATISLNIFPVRRLWGNKVAVFNILLLTLLPITFYMYINIRMYSLIAFFTMGVFVYAYDAYINKKLFSWLKLTFFALGALYTHNYAGLIAFVIYVFLFIFILMDTNKKKQGIYSILLSGIVIVIIYSPWLYNLVNQLNEISQGFWIPPLSFHDLLIGLRYYFSPVSLSEPFHYFFPSFWIQTIVITAIFLQIVIAIFAIRNYKKDKKMALSGVIAFIVFLLPAIVILCYSFWVQSIFLIRYTICFVSLYTLGMSLFLTIIFKNSMGRYLTFSFLGILTLLFFANIYANIKRDNLNYYKQNDVQIKKMMDSSHNIVCTKSRTGFTIIGQLSVLFPQNTFYVVTNNRAKDNDFLFNYHSGDTIALDPFKSFNKIKEIDFKSDFIYVGYNIYEDPILNQYEIVDSIPNPYRIYKLRLKETSSSKVDLQ